MQAGLLPPLLLLLPVLVSPTLLLALTSAANGRGVEAGLGEAASREVAYDRTWLIESDPSCLTLTQEQGFLGKEDDFVHVLCISGNI